MAALVARQAHRVLFAFRELVSTRRDELAAVITAEHGKVLADALGEVGRGLEVDRVRLRRSPQLLKGGYSENVSTEVDVWTDPPAARRGRPASRPFNFPAMVPLWMFADRDRLRQQLRAQAEREDPSAPRCCSPSWFTEAGLPDGVFNVRPGRHGGGRRR